MEQEIKQLLKPARDITREVAAIVRAPRRVRPSEAARAYLRNDRGPWDETIAPEMVEPLDLVADRRYQGIIVVGPARSSKTFTFVHGVMVYTIMCDPGDMLITHLSQDAARDFSRTEVDRVFRYSPEVAARMSKRARDDNTFDKFMSDGTSIKIGWPAISQLSAKTLRTVIQTDYDRPENRDDVDGEGSLWALGFKRIETYMSRGKCIAESSPGEETQDGQWKPSTPHEAPPVPGILSLYNTGTRARRYWPCKHCGEFFQAEPGIAPFKLPAFEECEKLVQQHDPMTLADRYARVHCPSCGGEHVMADRPMMKLKGVWLHEGETVGRDGVVKGTRRRSNIASFWLGGVAAAYQRWDAMLLKYFQALATYARTGEETDLKACVFTDFAFPYLSRVQAKRRTPEQFKDRLDEKLQRGVVPSWVRFLTAAVDVQARSYRVNVYGWGPKLESVPIDRYAIEVSKREDDGRQLAVDPAAFQEDWRLLLELVLDRTYPVDGIELALAPRLMLVDTGGKEGVTSRSYDFWRGLTPAQRQRVKLIKGIPDRKAPRVAESYPDNRGRSNRHAAARGDVPVYLLNVNLLKDGVSGDLARTVPGPGYVHLGKWLPPEFFLQVTAEVKDEKGNWTNPKNQRNEDWDLHVYSRAGCIILNAEKLNWDSPPDWATDLRKRIGKPTDAQARLARLEQLGREGF